MSRPDYDGDHQMFRRPAATPDLNYLLFLRDLAEKGRFDSKPLSAPRGDNVFRLSAVEIARFAKQQADSPLPADQKIRQHLAANGDY